MARCWPMYFAKQPLTGAKLALRVGDPFPIQSKAVIRGFGVAYGVLDAMERPFDELPFVETVDVHSEQMAQVVRHRGLRAREARQLAEGAA